ncbi:MAG: hypothetical protein ABI743_10695, partial [bacterium]
MTDTQRASWRQLDVWTTAQRDAGRAPDTIFRALLRRGWIPSIPHSIPDGPSASLALFAQWMDWVAAPLGSATPDEPRPDLVTCRALGDLVPSFEPADPWAGSDSLEMLYQRVVNRPRERSVRRALGQVFTPRAVADRMVAMLPDWVMPPLEGPLRILDPAIGAGVFWGAVIAQRLGPLAPWHRTATYADLAFEHLIGVDRDPLLIALVGVRSRAGWWALKLAQQAGGRQEFDQEPPEAWPLQLHLADYLADPLIAGKVNVVIGNPPYGFGETMTLEERRTLREHYEVATGPFDRAWCFMEAGMRALVPDGVLSLLVPDAGLGRPNAEVARKLLVREGTLLGIDHLGPVFPGTAVSSAVVSVRKAIRPAPPDLNDPEGLFEWHLLQPRNGTRLAGRLGDFLTISRGEEHGKRDCAPLADNSALIPIIRGVDIAPLGALTPVVGIVGPLTKTNVPYHEPKVLVVKTGIRPVAAVDRVGYACLQSVYMLTIKPQWIGLSLEFIAWLLNAPPIA